MALCPEYEHVVVPGSGNFQGALDVLLPFDLLKIGLPVCRDENRIRRFPAARLVRCLSDGRAG